MFPICVWQRAVPIQKWFSIVGLTTAKCWQARVSQRVSQSLLIFHFLRLALPKLYIYTQTNFSASSDLYIEYMYVCTWFLDLGELQLCAHILGSLAFKEFARENNVLLKMPSFIWCGNFLCRNILLKTILNQNCFLFLFYVFYFLFIFLFSISILCFYFSSQPRLFSNNMTLMLQDYLGK